MIKMAPAEPESESTSLPIEPPLPLPVSPKFPSASLIVMSVFSCFLSTAAFISSLTQIGTRWPYFVVANAIGFFLTVPFYTYLYTVARKNRANEQGPQTNPIFITPKAIVFIFVLVTLWAVIFSIDILSCVGTGGRYSGVVLSTTLAAFEWMVLLFIALRCSREVWRHEKTTVSHVQHQSTNAGILREPSQARDITAEPRFHTMYVVSFILCTLALVFSISPTKLCLVNFIAFFITAPYHITIFVSSLRPQSPAPPFTQPRSVSLALFLTAVWSWVFVVDIIANARLFQKIISGIFGGSECIVVIYLAVRTVLASLREGQIRLE